MDITGKLIHLLPIVTGTGSTGNEWKKRDFVIETDEQYPKKVCFTAFGDKMDALNGIAQNTVITVHFNAESREHESKWYTGLQMWKIVSVNTQPVQQVSQPAPQPQSNRNLPDENDLPF